MEKLREVEELDLALVFTWKKTQVTDVREGEDKDIELFCYLCADCHVYHPLYAFSTHIASSTVSFSVALLSMCMLSAKSMDGTKS